MDERPHPVETDRATVAGGHAGIRTTMNIYGNVVTDEVTEVLGPFIANFGIADYPQLGSQVPRTRSGIR
jgi:hypothetical protein